MGDETGLCGDSNANDVIGDVMNDLMSDLCKVGAETSITKCKNAY